MKKPINKYLYTFFITACLVIFLSSQLDAQVNQSELENIGPVELINYEGPYSRIETRAQIRNIGYGLGEIIKGGADRAGASGRYFVIHSVSGQDGSKLDADIFGLGPDVGVDHIRNLRLIIQGYLEAAYEYTERDAALLSEYVTIYNAVYRGDMGYFGSRYKNPVMANLNAEKAGLAIRYDEWPGQTLMVIPLGSGLGGALSSVDTTTISDSRVIEQLRQEPDMGLEQRKDMVDLKEREADEASQQAAITRDTVRQEEERIAREREDAQRRQQQAEAEQRRINEERQQPGADQQALDRQQEAAQQQEQEAKQTLEELDQSEQDLDDQKAEAERQEAFAEQKTSEAQEERRQIAEDQQSIIVQERAPAQSAGVLGFSLLNPDLYLGRLVKLDPNTGVENKRSPITTVNGRTVILVNNRIFAVAGENSGNGAIRLVEINPDTLEMVKQGDDDIAADSLLWIKGQDLYAITGAGDKYLLARFNMDLVLQSVSTMIVNPHASVLFSDGNTLVTQKTDGGAVLLNPSDLSEKK
jgi:hypothetical protein